MYAERFEINLSPSALGRALIISRYAPRCQMSDTPITQVQPALSSSAEIIFDMSTALNGHLKPVFRNYHVMFSGIYFFPCIGMYKPTLPPYIFFFLSTILLVFSLYLCFFPEVIYLQKYPDIFGVTASDKKSFRKWRDHGECGARWRDHCDDSPLSLTHLSRLNTNSRQKKAPTD